MLKVRESLSIRLYFDLWVTQVQLNKRKKCTVALLISQKIRNEVHLNSYRNKGQINEMAKTQI